MALTVVVLQGPSVRYGLVLDDVNHRAQLRAADGSVRSLVEAAHLGGPRYRVAMWWQEQADLHFFRPLAFGLMRLQYRLIDWRADLMHGFSLTWAILCGCLVAELAGRLLGSHGWGVLAGAAFAAHPGNFLTARWIACQNELMSTAFALAGLLAYGSACGWWPGGRLGGWRRGVGITGACVCYAAALGCRESAVVWPVLAVIGDLALRPAGWRARWPAYAAFGLIAAGYVSVRHQFLGPLVIPGLPYAHGPGEPGFVRFAAGKMAYYLLGLWFYVPIVGFSGKEAVLARPWAAAGMVLLLIAGWAAIVSASRERRVYILPLALSLVPLGPVLPVFASAHHLYLASAGMVVACVAAASRAAGWAAGRGGAGARLARAGLWGLAGIHVLIFGSAAVVYDRGLAGMAASGQLTVHEVRRLGRPPAPGDRLFFINLPLLAFNCIPAIEEATGVEPLRGYALTFCPQFLRMNAPTQVQRTGPCELTVRLEGAGWFSGLIGRSVLQGIGRTAPLAPGERFITEDFTAEVVHSTAEGVQELRFTFARPLDDPGYHFFLASRLFDAWPLKF